MKGPGHLPSVENLQCFLAAAEHLNFRRAAEEVALTPTAFGQRIQKIEQTLGELLFERTTRRVELTAAGRRLVPVARSVIAEARRCLEEVHAAEDPPANFVLGTRFELGLSWILPALRDMRDVRPNWDVHLYFGAGPDILEQLRNRRVDCVVTSAPIAEKDWSAEYLHPEHYVFVGSPGLLEENSFETPSDAPEHCLLDVDNALPLTRYLTSAIGEMDFGDIWLCGTGAAMHQLVLHGEGVAVLPRYMVNDDIRDGRLQVIFPDAELLADSFRLLYRTTSPLSSIFSSFAEYLRDRPLV